MISRAAALAGLGPRISVAALATGLPATAVVAKTTARRLQAARFRGGALSSSSQRPPAHHQSPGTTTTPPTRTSPPPSEEPGRPPKTTTPPTSVAAKPEPELTREEVEAIAERARNDERIWDAERKLFGGHIGWGHPLFFLLAGGAAALHFANARRDQQIEESEERLERMRREHSKRPLEHADLAAVLAHKRRQLAVWEAEASSAHEARARALKLRDEIAELEASLRGGAAPPPPGLA